MLAQTSTRPLDDAAITTIPRPPAEKAKDEERSRHVGMISHTQPKSTLCSSFGE
jgi:hypothetical protein